MHEKKVIPEADRARQQLIRRETRKGERLDEETLAEFITEQPSIPKAGKYPEKLEILKGIYAECLEVFHFVPEIRDVYLYVFPESEALRTESDGIAVWVTNNDVAIGLAETILTEGTNEYAKSVFIHELAHIILKDGHTADFTALWHRMVAYFNQEKGADLQCDSKADRKPIEAKAKPGTFPQADSARVRLIERETRRDNKGEVIHKSDQTYREERERKQRAERERAAKRQKQEKEDQVYSRVIEKLKGVVHDGKRAQNDLSEIEGGNEQLIEQKFRNLFAKGSFPESGQGAENTPYYSRQEQREMVCKELRKRIKSGEQADRDLEEILAGNYKILSKYLEPVVREMEAPSEKVEKALRYITGKVR